MTEADLAAFERPGRPPLPPNVAKAITSVMEEIPKLVKDEKNTHGGYKFAGIDSFYEAVRPICAKHGLIVIIDEDGCDVVQIAGKDGKARSWLMLRYLFTLAHSSGETWGYQPRRSIMVDASMGSQAFGAAQSYVQKLFDRALFRIATGEKGEDIDAHAPAELPAQSRRPQQRQPAPPKAPPAAPPAAPAAPADMGAFFRSASMDVLEKWFAKWNGRWETCDADAMELAGSRAAHLICEMAQQSQGPTDLARIHEDFGHWFGFVEKYCPKVWEAFSASWEAAGGDMQKEATE